jgi:Flp pilus assembly protein TadD
LFHIEGSILEELNRFTEAIEVYQRALEVEPKNNRVRYSMGNVLEKSGRRSQAIIEMEKILQDKPDDAGALNFVGYTLTVAGRDREKAEGMIRKAHELKPDDGYILDSFAWMLVQRGELEEGLEKLKLAAEKVKSDPVVCEHLGDAYLAKGDKQSAVEAFKKSLQINPENVVVKKKLEGLEKELGARTTQ